MGKTTYLVVRTPRGMRDTRLALCYRDRASRTNQPSSECPNRSRSPAKNNDLRTQSQCSTAQLHACIIHCMHCMRMLWVCELYRACMLPRSLIFAKTRKQTWL